MSPVISADVPDELKERIEDTREQKGDGQESRSKVVNRLLRAGLEVQDLPPGIYMPTTYLAAASGLLMAAIAFDWLTVTLTDTAGYVGLFVFAAAVLYHLLDKYTNVLSGINLSPADTRES